MAMFSAVTSCVFLACRCGTIGFYAAYWFVTKIYGECSWGGLEELMLVLAEASHTW